MTTPDVPQRPYLVRAMHEWMVDCGHTPHVVVDVTVPGVQVPGDFVSEDRIVLNISYDAAQNLDMGNHEIAFDARFSGNSHPVRFPVEAVVGIYARETGQGMIFPRDGDDDDPSSGPDGPEPGNDGDEPRPRDHLKIVK